MNFKTCCSTTARHLHAHDTRSSIGSETSSVGCTEHQNSECLYKACPYCLGQLPKLNSSQIPAHQHRSNSASFQNHLTSASSAFPQTIVAIYQTSRTPVAARKRASNKGTAAPKRETEKLLPRLFQAFQCTHDRCAGRPVWFRRLLNGSLRR